MQWGTGGVGPFEVLLVPVGHIKPEIRTIINYQNITPSTSTSDPSSFSFSFPLTFPAGSQFVAVLSDNAYGPGSGGTSGILTVAQSPTDDKSCLATHQVKPEFYFYLDPTTPSQCDPWEISWPKSIAELSPTGDMAISLWAIVPNEVTFAVPLPSTDETDPTDSSRECSQWVVDLKTGTQLMLVAGYEPGSKNGVRNGRGKGGSTPILTVGSGSGGSKCLAEDPPQTSLFPSTAPTSLPYYLPATTTTSTTTLRGANRKGAAAAPVRASSRILALAIMAAISVALI